MVNLFNEMKEKTEISESDKGVEKSISKRDIKRYGVGWESGDYSVKKNTKLL